MTTKGKKGDAMEDSANNEWWLDGPWWVEYAKQDGAHKCICPVCDREHEPDNGGYASVNGPCGDEDPEDGEEEHLQ
jgi:hypothetical protein